MRHEAARVALAILLALPAAGEPLRALHVATRLRARDFGAKPDDDADDLPALQRAVDAAVRSKLPARISLARGRYVLDPKGVGGQALEIRDGKDVILDGQGATLVVRNPQKGLLRLWQCERVIVRNLVLDYLPVPFTQGVVQEVDRPGHTVTVRLDRGFPSLDEPWFTTATHRWALVKEGQRPTRTKAGLMSVVCCGDWARAGDRTFRIDTAWFPLARVEPGDRYVQLARHNDAAAFIAIYAERCTFERIRIVACPAASYVALSCSGLGFVRCTTAPPKGRCHAGGADGIYCIQHRVGPWIEGCTFDAIADDAVVLKTKGAHCVRRLDARTFIVRGRTDSTGFVPSFHVRAGHRLRVFDPKGGRILGDAKVARATLEPDAEHWKGPIRLVLDRPLPGVEPASEWDSPVWYNDDTVGAGFLVRGCTFRNLRRWGVLCQSRDGVIEDCTFEGISAHAILMANCDQGLMDSDGFLARNVAIRDNTFRDCCHQDPSQEVVAGFPATVATVVLGPTSRRTPYRSRLLPVPGHRDITIERNRFLAPSHAPAVRIHGARDVVVRGNRFEGGDQAIVVDEASTRNVVVEGNASHPGQR